MLPIGIPCSAVVGHQGPSVIEVERAADDNSGGGGGGGGGGGSSRALCFAAGHTEYYDRSDPSSDPDLAKKGSTWKRLHTGPDDLDDEYPWTRDRAILRSRHPALPGAVDDKLFEARPCGGMGMGLFYVGHRPIPWGVPILEYTGTVIEKAHLTKEVDDYSFTLRDGKPRPQKKRDRANEVLREIDGRESAYGGMTGS
eukprot:g4739.t1